MVNYDKTKAFLEKLHSNELNDKVERGQFISGDKDALTLNLSSEKAMILAYESLSRNDLLSL